MINTFRKRDLESAKEIIKTVHLVTNIPNLPTRQHPHPQLRGAIAIALRRYFDTVTIAKALGRDRSTIQYYIKNHDANLNHWENYDELYKVALKQTEFTVNCTQSQDTIDTIDRQIKALTKERNMLSEVVSKLNKNPTAD